MSKITEVLAITVTVAAIGVLGAGFALAYVDYDGPRLSDEPKIEEVLVPLCATEDSVGPCWWDASTQGNGEGISFFVAENGDTFYLMDMPNCADAPEFDCLQGREDGR